MNASAEVRVEAPVARASAPCDSRRVALLAACASLAAFFVYWVRGDILLYGDAVAHIGIARRVVDSITPGFGQLGTVWLPLPHLLMIPFVAPLSWWRSGASASIPSLVAYIFATVGLFRLFRDVASRTPMAPGLVRAGAWLAAFAFAANPNLLYLQTTAMTEPLSLALIVWSLVWLARFCLDPAGPANRSRLVYCGILLCAAELTRYDGWAAAAVLVPIAFVVWLRSRFSRLADAANDRRPHALSAPAFALFLVVIALGPMFWFWWNYANTSNPLDFANGPYSARGIEQHVKNTVDARAHPGDHDVATAASYYVHAVVVNLGEKRWGPTVFWAAVAGTLLVIVAAIGGARPRAPNAAEAPSTYRPLLLWLPLWLPVPFYTSSIAYGSVPIFTPFRWPFSYYNVRYGLAALPAVAIFAAALVTFLASRITRSRARKLAVALAAVFVAAAYLSQFWQQPNRPKSLLPYEPWLGPIVWREAVINAATRLRYEKALADVLAPLPANSRILMYTGDHVGALERAGIPLRRVINEANYYEWRLALLTPDFPADYVVAADHDAVAAAVAADPENLTPMAAVDVPGQPRTVIYRVARPASPPADHDMQHMH